MSYLLDKKIKRRKLTYILVFVVFLFLIFHFRNPISNKLGALAHFIFRPFIYLGNSVGGEFSKIGAYFSFKSSLLEDKQNLLNTLDEKISLFSNYASVLDDNIKMKEILGRKNSKMDLVLAGILSKPNLSPYDTLVIDAGSQEDIKLNARVFAYGNAPIGRVAEVYAHSSKVILFSNPGEKTEVVLGGASSGKNSKNIFIQLVGRGGGNFETAEMKDLTLEKGTEVVLPGINPYIVATVEKTISDPRDSFDKVLLVGPVNIQELKFVEIEK